MTFCCQNLHNWILIHVCLNLSLSQCNLLWSFDAWLWPFYQIFNSSRRQTLDGRRCQKYFCSNCLLSHESWVIGEKIESILCVSSWFTSCSEMLIKINSIAMWNECFRFTKLNAQLNYDVASLSLSLPLHLLLTHQHLTTSKKAWCIHNKKA